MSDQKKSGKKNTVEQFEFEPIKGYPMLNWKGKRPFSSTQYYPAQLKESYGSRNSDGWMSRVFWGDNLEVMSHLLSEFRGAVDLVYLDPPFDSKANYKKRIQVKGKRIEGQYNAFEEKQYSDIWSNDSYLQFMYERLILTKELMKSNGLIFLHCDQNQGHYLRCLLDEVFGKENFINQVVWKRSDAHNDSGQGAKHFGSVHDVIYAYCKGEGYTWNQVYLPLPESTVENWYRNVEEKTGRRYNKADITGPGGEAKGNPVYNWKGVTRAWRFSKERMEQLDREGRIVYSASGMPYLKRYLDESKGIPLQDWWDDIQMVRGIQKRGEGHYPTEKPEALLERIISVGSSPGDLVFDSFMGSGTTAVAAMRNGRRFLGADINSGAVQICTKRLCEVLESDLKNKAGGLEVYSVNNYEVFRNPVEARELLLSALEITKLNNSIFDGEKDGRLVKLMPVNRIATRADLAEIINGLDRKTYEKRQRDNPNKPVEKITLVCMGHEPDLKAHLEKEVEYKLDVEIVDILRDKQNLQFKRDSEAKLRVRGGKLIIEKFYPMNLLQKLSLQKEKVSDWRELVESILIDWNFDGAVLCPQVIDITDKEDLVKGEYEIPMGAGTIRVKITDLLSESLEVEVVCGQ